MRYSPVEVGGDRTGTLFRSAVCAGKSLRTSVTAAWADRARQQIASPRNTDLFIAFTVWRRVSYRYEGNPNTDEESKAVTDEHRSCGFPWGLLKPKRLKLKVESS